MQSLRSFALCCGLLAVPAGPAAGDHTTVAAATNIAGLQRMLIQRIGQAYCLIGLRVQPQASREQLFDAVELFDEQLTRLEDIAPDEPIRDALARVRVLWHPVRAIATGPVSRQGANLVAYWSDDMLHAADKVVQLLQDVADSPFERLVNISGRQRMLSQRLAKFYMLRVWGFDTLIVRDGLQAASNEFSRALAVLRAAPENTPAIRRRLEVVSRDWEWIQKAIAMEGTDFFPLMIANASESILVRMDDITALYEALGRQVLPH